MSNPPSPSDLFNLDGGAPDILVLNAETSEVPPPLSQLRRGCAFWLSLVALLTSIFLSALDLSAVSTALPTIVADLQGTDYVWAGSAMTLGSVAFLPMCGGFAQIFGRRPVVIGTLSSFAVGSALCSFARNMSMLIADVAAQGIGGGGIIALTNIVIADLVPLRERGVFLSLLSAVWGFACAVGPPAGRIIAQHNWRWLFYINLPLTAIAMGLVLCFLNLKTPKEDLKSKIKRIDWIGNAIVVASTTSLVMGMSWGGIQHPWTSWKTLVPLILSALGLVVFLLYEFNWGREPVVPWKLVSNWTSLFGYVMMFLHGVVVVKAIFYLPVFFQGADLQTSTQSGLSFFGIALSIPAAAVAFGFIVNWMGTYRPSNFSAWALVMIGTGLLTLLRADLRESWAVGFQIIMGCGLGVLYLSTSYPIIGPLPFTESARALALSQFVRSFLQTVGITLGSAILQNELKEKLPASFLASFGGVEVAYALIPLVKNLEEPMKNQVRDTFADGTRSVWTVMIVIAAVGFLCGFVTREIKMPTVTDTEWGVEEKPMKLVDKELGVMEKEKEKIGGSELEVYVMQNELKSLG